MGIRFEKSDKLYLCSMFKEKIANYIKDKHLIDQEQKVLVALSGGADSVALLRVLLHLGFDCIAAHCNFHLRGEESNRDERFVRLLCEELGVELHVIHFRTEEYARNHNLSIEMAARELRYDWFETLRRELGADVVAVAHHLDDSVETFLLNLSRGTGINGLKGISSRNGAVVRPLLEVTRDEILDYLRFLHQEYVTDSTNLANVYMRNKIRLDIIPLFRLINPSFCESVSETAKRLSEVAAIYQQAMKVSLEKIRTSELSVGIDLLKSEVSPSCVLFEWLSPYGFNSAQIQDILRSLDGESGRLFYATDWVLLRDREELILRRTDEENEIPELLVEYKEGGPDYQVKRSKEIACLDVEKVHFPLTIRKWKSGDMFMPFGMHKMKKVRDYLRDRKFSLFDKEKQLVVLSNNQIVWLVNERVDQRFCVTDKSLRVVELRVKTNC